MGWMSDEGGRRSAPRNLWPEVRSIVMVGVNYGPESHPLAPIARRTILSDDALSVLVPLLEDIAGWNPLHIRAFFERQGLQIHEWDKIRTDIMTIREGASEGAVRGA